MDLLTLMETMAVRTQLPLFAPPPPPQRPATEIRFSRWNNANAQKFIQPKRTQKELEDRIRFERRFDSVLTISNNHNPAPPHPTTFKSAGTPSSPSPPSIPGKKSKYSKRPPQKTLHPAFKPLAKPRKIPEDDSQNPAGPNFRVDENGISYEMPEAPFVYQYSYTETPKVKPVKLREPLVSPFGPGTLAKPWLGRKPLPPSKKKLPEFDSFQLPPPHKKGVRPVQAPGPFLPGSGPKYVRSRAEVLGEPLSKDEIEKLVEGCKKDRRQLNMGRDGLTHNMLENVHALWKRRRVCKVKCKGVCTVDMDNVAEQLEEKTGGKIIYRRDGIIYLFRGRNYNYKSRPRFPLMLWKPITPVYPRLVQRVPEDLTLEEVSDMRKRGRDLMPICKLAKNGVYCDLVENVREAFEACELVRINCQGLNPSDYKKIGAKLKDLVPCVLLSFEGEHILMWRGREWKSSIVSCESLNGVQQVKAANPLPSVSSQEISTEKSMDESWKSSVTLGPRDDHPEGGVNQIVESETCGNHPEGVVASEIRDNHPAGLNQTVENDMTLDGLEELERTVGNSDNTASVSSNKDDHMSVDVQCREGIMLLRKEAVENGMAFVLDESSLDADSVFEKAVAFVKTAPAGPVFRHYRAKKVGVETNKEEECDDSDGAAAIGTEISVSRGRNESKVSRSKRMEEIKGDYLNVVPQGSLRVDELAKLLA